MTIFRVEQPVRFQHCDPAGIMFFPRAFELINNAIEDWFAHTTGMSAAELHFTHRRSLPTVRIECEFSRPSRLGDVLTFTIAATEVGSSSVAVVVEARCREELRLRSKSTLVHVEMRNDGELGSCPLPQGMREKLLSPQPAPSPA